MYVLGSWQLLILPVIVLQYCGREYYKLQKPLSAINPHVCTVFTGKSEDLFEVMAITTVIAELGNSD